MCTAILSLSDFPSLSFRHTLQSPSNEWKNIAGSCTTLKSAIFFFFLCCIVFHKLSLPNVSNSFSPPAQTNSEVSPIVAMYQRQHLLTIKCWFEMAPTHISVLKYRPTFFFLPQKSKRGETAGRERRQYIKHVRELPDKLHETSLSFI